MAPVSATVVLPLSEPNFQLCFSSCPLWRVLRTHFPPRRSDKSNALCTDHGFRRTQPPPALPPPFMLCFPLLPNFEKPAAAIAPFSPLFLSPLWRHSHPYAFYSVALMDGGALVSRVECFPHVHVALCVWQSHCIKDVRGQSHPRQTGPPLSLSHGHSGRGQEVDSVVLATSPCEVLLLWLSFHVQIIPLSQELTHVHKEPGECSLQGHLW